MTDLSFDLEWVDPEGARGLELRATWARLTLVIAGEPVTRVFDERTRSVRTSIYLPLYPLAEWIATNWWRLLYEVPSPRTSTQNGYQSRHCLAKASEGFAFPDLSLEPLGETVRLSWAGRKLLRTPVEFLGGHTVFLNREMAQEGLERFVDAVLGRLEDGGIEGTLLHQEWRAICNLAPEEETFCRLAGTLGLDPFQLGKEEAEELLDAAEKIPEVLQDEFFSSADPSALLQEAEAVDRALEAVAGTHQGLEPLRRLRESFNAPELPGEPPWKQGYAAAGALRADLGLDGSPLPSFEALSETLGVQRPLLEREVKSVSGLETVDGVVAFDDEQRPGFALRATADEARIFGFCRELFEYLAAPGPDPLLVTRGGTHRQQRNRAFAAEFLLPSEALRDRVRGPVVTYEEVNKIAEAFGVSWAVVSHQLDNHRIARISAD